MAETPLWTPSAARIAASNISGFLRDAERRTGRVFASYPELHEWSVTDTRAFWEAIWDLLDPIVSRGYDAVVDDPRKMPGARWFEGARLNFAENLLRHRDPRPAIIFRDEIDTETRTLTYTQLADEVARIARGLRDAGVRPGDRVVGFMPNIPETVIAMLAAASVGAIWSSCSPDFGIKGVLDRFQRVEPAVLFTAAAYHYGGKQFDCLLKVTGILEELGSSPLVVVVPHAADEVELDDVANAIAWDEFRASGETPALTFEQLPFDHPLYIMYSSGTTGLPKCIVQSAGGILINQLKEHVLHVDLKRDDVIFYFTTCGWMMWNWLVAALGTGSTIALFDGNPFHPDPGVLWRYAEESEFTVFGTSAKYLAALEKSGTRPGWTPGLRRLRTILSTGSPLTDEQFDYVYRDIKKDVCLSSISGGTDLNGCFVGGCPILPVHRGEIQCKQLGMNVHAWDEEGNPLIGETGELVCTTAFPSMPLRFWGDDDGTAYHAAYFERFPGVWTHGDFMSENERGGLRITGRSDATLNPGGVRIGTAEIYRQVEPMEEILDSLVIGQPWKDDVRVVLFVKLAGDAELTDELADSIRRAIRTNCSPRHVPAKIIAVDDIPYTLSGKKVELAVRNIVEGKPVKNSDALKNPESLECYAGLKELAT